MTTEPLRWGVLGAADIALAKVIPAIQASTGGQVVALGSRTLGSAAEAADRLGIERAYGDYESVLGDPDVEAVYIPLPNHLHRPWTETAAAVGKHVLCEKPLALTTSDARAMIGACEQAGVVLMEAFMYRLHPLWTALVDHVRSGTIGEVRAVQTVFSYFNDDGGDIRNQTATGGGALYDVGCYAVNLSRMIFDAEPVAVHGAVRRDDRFGTDVVTSALLDFDGRHATLICGTQLEDSQRVEVLGTTGRLVVDIPFNIPPHLPTRLQIIAGGDPPVTPAVEVIEIPAADPYGAQTDAFARAVREDLPVPVPTADSVANLAVIEQIFASA